MSTRGHSTIDRIVSATLEERRERYRSSLLSLAGSLLPSLSVPLSLGAISLFSRVRSSRLSIDFPPLDESKRRRASRGPSPSTLPVRLVDDHCFDLFHLSSLLYTRLL